MPDHVSSELLVYLDIISYIHVFIVLIYVTIDFIHVCMHAYTVFNPTMLTCMYRSVIEPLSISFM